MAGANPDSLRVLFAAAHTNPTAKRRTQVLRKRQRVRNRSELRLLLDGLAYPELGHRQHLTGVKRGRAGAKLASTRDLCGSTSAIECMDSVQ